MGLADLPRVTKVLDNKDLSNIVAMIVKELESVINGRLDVKNIRAEGIETKNLKAESITTEKIQAGAVKADRIDVDKLSAITADMGKLTAGEIFGAYIATAEGTYPRIDFSSVGNLLQAYKNLTEYIAINPSYTGSPTVIMNTPNASGILAPINSAGAVALNATIGKLSINSQTNNVNITAGDDVVLSCDDLIINNRIGWTGNINTGTVTISVKNGIIYDVS